jgi:hypothetical protein
MRMRLVGHVAYVDEMRKIYRIWLESLWGRDHLENLGIGGRIISN